MPPAHSILAPGAEIGPFSVQCRGGGDGDATQPSSTTGLVGREVRSLVNKPSSSFSHTTTHRFPFRWLR
ncbi:hypothetical protein Pcinc_021393 [Petrolisthes cinctipes]|uniref:Uncharacterized protein n=1 Tax=Petrolisthes cinctipes TaxID=88211 RepID=A0AAE1KJX0_PETCI|nr:hypothetical protein Pcinc_021393 [Petrolisthes cinctipes]